MFTKKIRIVAALAVIVAFGAITSSAFAAQVEGPGPGLADNGSQQATSPQPPFAIAPHHPEVMGTRTPQVTPPVHQIVRPVHFAGRGVAPSPVALSSDDTGFGVTDGLLMAGLLAGTLTLIAISAHRPRPRRALN
jgi:hypothetical protein